MVGAVMTRTRFGVVMCVSSGADVYIRQSTAATYFFERCVLDRSSLYRCP
jgi:hypothetical protein